MPKFLLDENVRRDVGKFLKAEKIDVKIAPKSTGDDAIAAVSKKERRIVVTNDVDFSVRYGSEKIFSIVWLRISQSDAHAPIVALTKLMDEFDGFEGKLITLYPDHWEVSPLIRE